MTAPVSPRRAVQPRILAIVLAGGAGGRLGVLTDHRAKPVMPLAGSFRLIDVALSNLHPSGISDVWIMVQYQPKTINDHLRNGRPWDLDRTRGGSLVLPPFSGEEGGVRRGQCGRPAAPGRVHP